MVNGAADDYTVGDLGWAWAYIGKIATDDRYRKHANLLADDLDVAAEPPRNADPQAMTVRSPTIGLAATKRTASAAAEPPIVAPGNTSTAPPAAGRSSPISASTSV
ncbi:MAG: hypothetical protein EXQ91_08905 [Alphaproteobacteria bacterium]|nr:hypothetical protein [Alphaproteobacteria bacterium]